MSDSPSKIEDVVASNYPEMLTSFGVSMGNLLRKSAIPLLEELPRMLPNDEKLVAFVQAKSCAPAVNVILAATTNRLVAFAESDKALVFVSHRDSLVDAELEAHWWYGSQLTFQSPDGPVTFRQLLPPPQAERILALAGGVIDRPNRLDLLTSGQPDDPGHPPLATFWNLALYKDRMIDHEGRHLPFAGGPVSASCDTAGNLSVTRGRNLAAKGVGTLFLGPIGLFGVGNAKERQTDSRELYLLVEGPSWAFTQPFQPDAGVGLRQFAQQIELVARNHDRDTNEEDSAHDHLGPTEAVATIRELAALRDEGILTEDEFTAQKQRLLGKI